MTDAAEEPAAEDYVAARLIVNMLVASAHDSRSEVAVKTGIDPSRLHEILLGHSYPDWYEIAAFERAYQRRLWPKQTE